jgi:hypothetical protein
VGQRGAQEAQSIWDQLLERHVFDDTFYGKVLSALVRQLGLRGLRKARILNERRIRLHCPVGGGRTALAFEGSVVQHAVAKGRCFFSKQ